MSPSVNTSLYLTDKGRARKYRQGRLWQHFKLSDFSMMWFEWGSCSNEWCLDIENVGSRNWTRATLVGGPCSHHFANPASLSVIFDYLRTHGWNSELTDRCYLPALPLRLFIKGLLLKLTCGQNGPIPQATLRFFNEFCAQLNRRDRKKMKSIIKEELFSFKLSCDGCYSKRKTKSSRQ